MSLLRRLFSSMAIGRLAFPSLVIIPAIFIVFLAMGWTRDEIVETRVRNIWSSTRSDYYKDRQYETDVGVSSAAITTFLAMAVSRDEGNIFNADRLEEIRSRMEATETVTVEHDGNTFAWSDVCALNNIGLGTVYEFPCIRLTPLDFFQEASWYLTEKDRVSWYQHGIIPSLVKPIVPRFGIMSAFCTSTGSSSVSDSCDDTIRLRTDPDYAHSQGYPDGYAKPLSLLSDVIGMSMENPCRICIENTFENFMNQSTQRTKGLFQIMAFELDRHFKYLQGQDAPDFGKMSEVAATLQSVANISAKLNRGLFEEFFTYYTIRGLIAEFGAAPYLVNYARIRSVDPQLLPEIPENVQILRAMQHLNSHADSPFSSLNTAGSPYRLFDKDGNVLGGNLPYGGSGIDLSGRQGSSADYFDAENFNTALWSPLYGANSYADPSDAAFNTDPLFVWFMAGETEMTAYCGNENFPSTNFMSAMVSGLLSQSWCTKYNEPFETDGTRTKQHFAKMWYNIYLNSDPFLGIKEGETDPYTWTSGTGCHYSIKGSRAQYTGQNETEILRLASRELYALDEGASSGALDKNILMGGSGPNPNDVSPDNLFDKVTTVQTMYPALIPESIVDRVRNCNRPDGPVDITVKDAEIILEKFKAAMTKAWTKGWDDNDDGDVLFTGFFDDAGVLGTFGTVLADITLDNGRLTAWAIGLITLVSVLFLFSFNPIESKVAITLVGIALVVLSFYAALGFGILLGIKININIAWTLPFVILGLGVDDMYIVMLAIRKENGYTKENFVTAMKEIFIPVTMTSVVNASMFAVMNIIDIAAIYKTAQAALISVCFLYIVIVFCFPAYCYLDMRRQAANKCDVAFCSKSKKDGDQVDHERSFIFDWIYKPLVIKSVIVQICIVIGTFALFGVGVYGITQRQVGLGIEDFFPSDHQASRWASVRTEELATWPVGMAWGALDYTDPDEQMQMIKQYEDVVNTPYVSPINTDSLWIAEFNLWTTYQCSENVERANPSVLECGNDQLFIGDAYDNSTSCSGTWKENIFGLKLKIFSDPKSSTCTPLDGGICRPFERMHPLDLAGIGNGQEGTDYCPVFEGWSNEKLKFCIEKWREFSGGSGRLIVEENTATPYEACEGEYYTDDKVVVPLKFSTGPNMYAYDLKTHEDTLELIKETRKICDESEVLHCWMTGIPYDYWEQYLTVESVLARVSIWSVVVGSAVATAFLMIMLKSPREGFGIANVVVASFTGGVLLACTTVICLVSVVGVSCLVGVNLTAFSNMSFVLSTGFSVEYSVHVIHRFLSAPLSIQSASDRVAYTMQFLALPLTLSFLSSTIGIICLRFTSFKFNQVYFFRPLIIVMLVTYFVGAFFLPVCLTKMNFDALKVGQRGEENEKIGDVDKFRDNHGLVLEGAKENNGL